MKKFRVSGSWNRTYFAKDPTHANEIANKDLKGINNQNIKFNVQNIDLVKENDS